MATADELRTLKEAIQQMQQTHQLQLQQLQNQIAEQQRIIQEQQQREQQIIIQQQQQQIQQIKQPPFVLTPEQVLKHFGHLRAFNGRDSYKLSEFIKSVENAITLCNENTGLLQYAIQIVFNEKIQGEAKRCIQRLGDNLKWDIVKNELKLHFRPREDYAELVNRSRNIKVNTLRELFEYVRDINYLLNELYDFDEDKPCIYSPENNDKLLVSIVVEKIDNLVRGYIPNNATLIEIYNKFADLKLLDDERAVSRFHKKYLNSDKREINSRNKHKQTFHGEPNKNNFNDNKRFSNTPRDNSYKNNIKQSDNYRQNSGQFRQYNNYIQKPGQNRQFNNYEQNFGQNNVRPNYSMNPFPQQTLKPSSSQIRRNNVEPMEVENIQKEDVNFTQEPRETNYQS